VAKKRKNSKPVGPSQQELFKPRGDKPRGGKRPGAGRPKKQGRASQPHRRRAKLAGRYPVLVTVRVEKGIGKLRKRRAYQAIRRALRTSLGRTDFSVVHVSIQRTHVHFIVEAHDQMALAKGMQGLQIAAARYLNAAASAPGSDERRHGRVFVDRYHARILKTPREVRNALAYVLGNWRHHREDRGPDSMFWEVDPFSTAKTFGGWQDLRDPDTPRDGLDELEPLPRAAPQTWLMNVGWVRHGFLRVGFVPGPELE
jgi:REP element-mobilizing transposase RayT